MKKTVNLLVLMVLASLSPAFGAQAPGPWEILARSPGAIEAATLTTSGQVCVLEQLRFTRIAAGSVEAQVRELPMAERIYVSPSGAIQASITYEGVKDVANAAQMTVSRDGKQLWSLEHHALNDVFPLESGGAVGVNRNINLPLNSVYFLSPHGELIKQLELPAVGEIKTSLSGDRILINSGVEGSLLYSAAGDEIARLGTAYRMFFSADGRWAAILHGPRISLYLDGRAAYSGELGGEIVRGVAFSPDHALFAAFTDHALFLMRNPSGEVVMQRQLEAQGEWSFASVDLTKDASCIAIGIERDLGSEVKGPDRHPEGEVRLYNRDGSICYQQKVTYTRWNTTTPRVQFSADGRQLLVLTRDEVMRAPVESLCGTGGEE
jgi:hypothetical protein